MATAIISRRLSSKTFNPTNFSHLILPSHLLSKTPNPTTSSQTPLNPPPFVLPESLSPIITKHKDHNFTPSPPIKIQSLLTHINPVHDQKPRYHSTSRPTKNRSFKHREFEGPTVERDTSSLAKETREVLEATTKNLSSLSWVVALLGLVQLGLGVWISYATKAAPMVAVSIQSAVTFGFPLALAFLMRRSLKPMHKKMEQMERLKILTLTMQVAKQLNLMFVWVRGAAEACVVGMAAGMLYAFLSN